MIPCQLVTVSKEEHDSVANSVAESGPLTRCCKLIDVNAVKHSLSGARLASRWIRRATYLAGPKLRSVKISHVVSSDCKIHQTLISPWYFFVLESAMVYLASCLSIVSCSFKYRIMFRVSLVLNVVRPGLSVSTSRLSSFYSVYQNI